MPQLVPSILENSKEAFSDTLARELKLPGVERLQVDFGDGVFVPNKILPVSEINSLNPAFHWEAHLMVKEPSDFLDYQIVGFKTLFIHYEAYPSVEKLKQALAEIKKMGFKNGVAINPATPVEILKDIEADQYLIMGVVPGKQGQQFIEATIGRIKQLRSLLPHAIIEVDGGVNEANIKKVGDAGADLIILGSAITKAPNMLEAYEKLQKAMASS